MKNPVSLIKKHWMDQGLEYVHLLGKRSAQSLSLPDFPIVREEESGIQVHRQQLNRFADLCGFAALEQLPVPFPHLMAMPLQLRVLNNPGLPITALGVVHIVQRIRPLQPIPLEAILDFQCSNSAPRTVAKGIELDLSTQVSMQGELAWEGLSTILFRDTKRLSEKKSPKSPLSIRPDWEVQASQTWELTESLGRQYALVSGDINPIHLHALSARLFGYNRPIIHGMYSLSRCLGLMESRYRDQPLAWQVEFKAPVKLPSTVECLIGAEADQPRFELRSDSGKVLHLKGAGVPLE